MQTTDCQKQAHDFLQKFSIKFRATLSDSKVAPWIAVTESERQRHHYRVTLSKAGSGFSRKDGTSGNGRVCDNCGFIWVDHLAPNSRCPRSQPARIVFDFWGSINDAEKGIKTVTPYDVLACISSDASYADMTFQDWCGEFGEDEDSIKALQTFRRCSAFGKRLQAFFTEEELQALQEIQ